MYKSKKLNLEKLKKASDKLVYKAWEQAMSDAEDCWGMGSELLMYDDDLHNDCEDDLKVLTEIVLLIQEEMDKRGIEYEKTITEPHQPEYATLRKL